MKQLVICLIAIFLQSEAPFKPDDQFQVNVELKFKAKSNEYNRDLYAPGGVPIEKPKTEQGSFLEVNIVNIKTLPEEVKVQIVDSQKKTLQRKKTSSEDIHLELGFVDDLKSKTATSEVTIYFQSSKKENLSKIVLTINPDGEFLVNGKWHGKF
ncbi:MAG: hypothetical protein QM734_13240 [Cyclobacteriaceae bacterium]